MLAFHEKFNLIHQLHPITNLVFTGVVFLLALICSHPLYLLVLFMATGTVIIAAGHREEWLSYLKFSLIMILMLMIVNVTFVHYGGDRTLYRTTTSGDRGIDYHLGSPGLCRGMGLRLLAHQYFLLVYLVLYILIKSSNYSATAAANRYWWSLWRLACFPSWFRTIFA